MRNIYRVTAAVVFVLFLFFLTRLARFQNGSPPHQDFELPGGEPATMYMPGTTNQLGEQNPFYQLFPSPPESRPPAVVLVHGFSADRMNVSALARRIAQNGYGVVTIDVHGHGSNRNPFSNDIGGDGILGADIKNAVEFLRHSNLVDGTRIVVMGHSMGAGASLDFATRDPGLKGAVMISGGFSLEGPERPRNTLFIFAQNDPGFIRESSATIAAHLAGVDKPEPGKVYGDFASGTAVEAIEIPSVNHITIIWSAPAAENIIKWLDGACGVKRAGEINLAEPRLNTILVVLALFILLIAPIGWMSGGLVTPWVRRAADRNGWLGLALVAGALFAAMPLIAVVTPTEFIPLVVGDIVISWIAVAGGLLIALIALRNPIDVRLLEGTKTSTILAALFAFAAVYVMSAYDVTLHRATVTPERLVAMVGSGILVLPFFISFELLLRRGGTGISTLLGSLGRVLIVVTMVAGLAMGVIPFVVGLILIGIVLQLAMMEIFAAAAYSASGNLLLIAIVESLWFARLFAISSPITFKF